MVPDARIFPAINQEFIEIHRQSCTIIYKILALYEIYKSLIIVLDDSSYRSIYRF